MYRKNNIFTDSWKDHPWAMAHPPAGFAGNRTTMGQLVARARYDPHIGEPREKYEDAEILRNERY